MNLSVGIITCNRPLGLKRLLNSLNHQNVSHDCAIDILVIDNACDPQTKKIVMDLNLKHQFSLKYFDEPEPGIVAARNKCVSQFLNRESENLIFIDDDEWPESDSWIQDMLTAKKRYNADIIVSHVISKGEENTPVWATQLLYGKNKFQEGQTVSVFYTGNVLISRQVLEKIKPAFDSRFAMSGASDYHFALKCKKQGFIAYYTKSPVIEEFPNSRAKVSWFIKRGYRSGIGFTKSHLIENKWFKSIPFCLLMASVRFIRGIFYLLYGSFTFNKVRFVDGLFRLSSFVGSIAVFFGMQYLEYKTIHGK